MFLQPKSFSPYEWLPSKLHRREDEARCFINILARKTPKTEVGEFVNLHSGILRRFIDWRGWPVIDALIESGCIERDDTYEPAAKSYGYRLNRRWLSDHPAFVDPETATMRLRLDRASAQYIAEEKARRLPSHDMMHDVQLNDLTIDGSLAREILATFPKEIWFGQRWIIQNIENQTPFNKVCQMGRWHNGLCSLKKELRVACQIDGEPMKSVDLSCCQPALLAMLILGKIYHQRVVGVATYPGVTREEESYGEMCGDGSLYDEMVDRSDGLTRDEIKKRFVVDCFATKKILVGGRYVDYPSPVRDLFKSMFPRIYRYIRAVNRQYHGTLICELQRLEAWLMFQHIAPKALERCPILTVHDAVFCGASNVGIVHEAFEEAFRDVGYRMRTKEEDWGPSYNKNQQ